MLFSSETLSALIGVIDLKAGAAVHAIAGKRNGYLPVESFCGADGISVDVQGDPLRLVTCYVDAGVPSLYVADLDALQGGANQWQWMERIARHDPSIPLFLDLGLVEDKLVELGRFLKTVPQPERFTVIVASESAEDPSILRRLGAVLPNHQIAVSFDFRDGKFVSRGARLEAWVEACQKNEVGKIIALDVAAVGGAGIGAASRLCTTFASALPDCSMITGGGVRTQSDARTLLQTGADRLLVASAFLG